jgi:histidinol dehydrogenase
MSRSSVLRQLNWSQLDASQRLALVDRDLNKVITPELREQISALVLDVRERGDAAVCDALAKFDKVDVSPSGLRVSDDEWESAPAKVDPALRVAIADMVDHIRRFNEQLLSHLGNWQFESDPGLMVGERVSAISSAGLFCPSGKASYPSVLAQLGTPAVVAGVKKIAVVVPPQPGANGAVDPVVITVARELGLREIFRVNGPAGVAALAFGTESIPRVVKLMGPGSLPVTVAQLEVQRYGTATQMALGPTESVVIADDSADPIRLAADLLIEAEHGTDSCTLLITTSAELAAATEVELVKQIAQLPEVRAEAAASSLGINGGCVLVKDMAEAALVANEFAPEHLQLVVRSDIEESVIEMLVHAGEILLGQDTPFSAGNFVLGPPASLPTNGYAKAYSGVSVDSFVKKITFQQLSQEGLEGIGDTVELMAAAEGLEAHRNAVAIRRK